MLLGHLMNTSHLHAHVLYIIEKLGSNHGISLHLGHKCIKATEVDNPFFSKVVQYTNKLHSCTINKQNEA